MTSHLQVEVSGYQGWQGVCCHKIWATEKPKLKLSHRRKTFHRWCTLGHTRQVWAAELSLCKTGSGPSYLCLSTCQVSLALMSLQANWEEQSQHDPWHHCLFKHATWPYSWRKSPAKQHLPIGWLTGKAGKAMLRQLETQQVTKKQKSMSMPDWNYLQKPACLACRKCASARQDERIPAKPQWTTSTEYFLAVDQSNGNNFESCPSFCKNEQPWTQLDVGTNKTELLRARNFYPGPWSALFCQTVALHAPGSPSFPLTGKGTRRANA